MKESESNSKNNWVFKLLIALYGFNILIHTYCIGQGLYSLIFESADELGIFFTSLMVVIPFSMFSAILIMVFNNMKKRKGVKYENYMFYLTLFFIASLVAFMANIVSIVLFQIVIVIFSLLGVIVSIHAIRNSVVELKINGMLR